MDRNGQKQTEIDKTRPNQTETDRQGQKETQRTQRTQRTVNNRNGRIHIETNRYVKKLKDKKGQQRGERARNRQKQT